MNKVLIKLKEYWGLYLYYKYKRIYTKNPRKAADLIYHKFFGRNINWDNPRNLIEKISWMSLNTDTSLWSLCADKYRVREYLKEVGLESICPKCYGFWTNPDNIDFNSLPNQFVIKANNGCGSVKIVCDKSKLNIEQTKKMMKGWLNHQFGYIGAQKHYLNIKPGILIEELLHQSKFYDQLSPNSLIDFKVWCINGEPEGILIVYDRRKSIYCLDFYDVNWERRSDLLSLGNGRFEFRKKEFPKPKCLDQILAYSRILSKPFKEVRVDFYIIDEKPVLGELTFTAGYGNLTEDYYNFLGDKINLK